MQEDFNNSGGDPSVSFLRFDFFLMLQNVLPEKFGRSTSHLTFSLRVPERKTLRTYTPTRRTTTIPLAYLLGSSALLHILTLNTMFRQETLDEWQACQRTWMYLESIFGSPDIVRQLPAAAKMFQAVDKSWRHIMVVTADEPLAIKQV